MYFAAVRSRPTPQAFLRMYMHVYSMYVYMFVSFLPKATEMGVGVLRGWGLGFRPSLRPFVRAFVRPSVCPSVCSFLKK